jgi:hypothetical protein
MRASLAHPFAERRALRRRRPRADHHLGAGLRKAVRATAERATSARSAGAGPVAAARPIADAPPVAAERPVAADTAARRARDAGGPVDRASYSCSCGYVFAAAVSTSVTCPICGTCQAW